MTDNEKLIEEADKAHTPTDDKRGDRSRLITIINEIQSHDPFVIADVVLAAGFGFRRTEVPNLEDVIAEEFIARAAEEVEND